MKHRLNESQGVRFVRFVRRAATIIAVLAVLRVVTMLERQPVAVRPSEPAAIPQQQRAILTDKTPTIKHEYPTN